MRRTKRASSTDQSSKDRLKYGFVDFETYIDFSALSLFAEQAEKCRSNVKHVFDLLAWSKDVCPSMRASSRYTRKRL